MYRYAIYRGKRERVACVWVNISFLSSTHGVPGGYRHHPLCTKIKTKASDDDVVGGVVVCVVGWVPTYHTYHA